MASIRYLGEAVCRVLGLERLVQVLLATSNCCGFKGLSISGLRFWHSCNGLSLGFRLFLNTVFGRLGFRVWGIVSKFRLRWVKDCRNFRPLMIPRSYL